MKKKELDQFNTSFEHIEGSSYRIFIERFGVKFSIVIQTIAAPSHEQTVAFFQKNSKHFDIEAEILEIIREGEDVAKS